MIVKTFRCSAYAVSAIAISACGGSDTSGENLISNPIDIVTSAVEATVEGDSLNSAASFPLRYTLNEPGDSQASIQQGVGRVEVIDEDTIQITLQQGDTPVELISIAPGNDRFTGLVDGEVATVNLARGSGTILAFLEADTAENDFGLTGIYGFETPESRLPIANGNTVYDTAGLATAYVASSDDSETLRVNQDAATNPALTINFGTGDVFGTLFNGTATVDLEDDGSKNDTLNLTVEIMNGSISSGDITGEVSLVANVDLGTSAANVDLSPTVSDSFVDATVYGYDANVVGGNFQATSQFNDGSETFDAVVGGTFFTVN